MALYGIPWRRVVVTHQSDSLTLEASILGGVRSCRRSLFVCSSPQGIDAPYPRASGSHEKEQEGIKH